MNIVIPMAGRGERFRRAGYSTAKPLIEIDHVPLYLYATLCLPLEAALQIIYVVLEPEWPGRDIAADLRPYLPAARVRVVGIPAPTRGQSETVLGALSGVDGSAPLLIYNCDSFFAGTVDWPALAADAAVDGALVCFKSSDPRYSFARLGPNGLVDLVTEKDPVSDNACTGAYYFRNTDQFASLARTRLEQGRSERGEFYVAPLYNDLIAAGGRVTLLECSDFICFGTPEELQQTVGDPRARALLKSALARPRSACA